MPIYEYRCHQCQRRVSIFFRSFSAVGEATCPRCGGTDLTRLVSRVAVIRRTSGEATGGGDDLPVDPDAMWDQGFDENDPRSVARWARTMSEQLGEPIEPEFGEALNRIEAGEDPDRVMQEIDGQAGAPADDGDGGDEL